MAAERDSEYAHLRFETHEKLNISIGGGASRNGSGRLCFEELK